MKRLSMMALCSLVLCATGVNAQITMGGLGMPGSESNRSPIDKIQFIVQYEMAFIQDISNPDQVSEETMILKVGERTSVFYSYTKYVTDSLMREQAARSGGMFMRQERGMGGSSNQGQINYQIYKNHPAGKVTTLDRVGPSQFRVEETNECPEWEIASDTTTILSYLCYQATCHFKGRDYTVWFTPEIPRSEGPWKLCGLPGLILHAEDSQHHFVFECTGLLNAQPDEMILYGSDNYEPVTRRNLNRAYERFAADPIGYTTSSAPNLMIRLTGPDGQPQNPRNIPYNPIELSE